jgi:hypothetical protein
MYLDYSKLKFDADGNPETPVLILKTMGENTIGIIPGVFNLHLNIKFSEPSEISFDVPAVIDGEPNWIYDRLTGHKIVYTEHYGIYVLMNPSTESDGVYDVKHIEGYSIEQELDNKTFFLEEGTFKFYDQTSPSNPDTIMGRILEVARGWSVGYVSPTLAQRYRTFDQYDDYLLDFVYNEVPEKFRGVFVFDPYERTINAYDADEQLDTLPIYLDFDNLIETIEIEELSDELVTALRPYGADELDIRDVNPIGTNWVYDLSYFISNGDIPDAIAEKWNVWQKTVLNHQQEYQGLAALRASTTAQLLSEKAALVDLQGELETLTSQQSVTIQALAMETTTAGKQSQQELLDEINSKIAAKKSEIETKENLIESIEDNLDAENPESYVAQIQDIVNELSITNYFTDDEYNEISRYLIEQDITENTFVATSVDTTISGTSYTVSNETFVIQNSSITRIDLTDKFNKRMYTFSGGTFTLSGSHAINGDIIRGTLEENDSGEYVFSIYGGSISSGSATASSGMVTISGVMTSLSSDIHSVTVDEVTTYEGTTLQFFSASGSLFLTANVSDYQKYSVQMELFDYAVDVLSDLATPTYEFSVDSGNFIFASEFAPFRNKLELGKGVYLNVGDRTVITPYIIEFELDFEDREDFSIVFSNRFKRHDNCNTLKDMVEQGYSSGRSFDASKYIYNQTVNHASAVSEFMNNSLDAAKNTILAASNQSVIINGAGIHVGGDSNYQLRIVDSMIAMTDDNWGHAKLAIGLFSSEEVGTYFGVNAEVIGGKLIVGNNLVIENETDSGVMQFKVDSSGAWLNNSTFVLQKDNGGKLLIDPAYGIVAGLSSLFTTSGTTVYPSFVDSDGDMIFDSDGMPENANFFLDLRDGSAYFRGNITATSGVIGGFTIEDTFLHGGSGSSYVALHGSGSGTNSAYAIWAGSSNPSSAPFYVMKNGNLYARNGTFSGTVSGASFKDSSGNSMMNNSYEFTADYLNLNGINVGGGNFVVDASGNVSIKGSITMAAGSSINWALVNESNVSQSTAYTMANTAYNLADNAYNMADSAYSYADDAYDLAWDNRLTDVNVFNVLTGGGTRFGIFSDSTTNRLYINASYIRAGTIDADLVTLENADGGFCCARGSDGVNTTYGAKMFGSAGPSADYYVFVSNKGAMLSGGSAYLYCAGNGIHASDEISVDSDARLKNDIRMDVDKYEQFLLGLKPSTFCLNGHNETARHIGFIAQDVAKVRDSCGLSNEELALLELCEKNMPDGSSDMYYSIRYGELIPLCVHMIQKMYARINALENDLKKG